MEFISIFDVLGPNMVGPSSSHTAGACSIALMARTYKGHGTDRALLAGVMGCSTDDVRIPRAYELAKEQNLTWRFSCNETETEVHPNTVDIDLTGITGKTVSMRGESVGGGKIRIARINGIDVDFSGECNTLIVVHKGDKAYSIVEFDGKLPEHTKEKILLEQDVEHVMLIQIREG